MEAEYWLRSIEKKLEIAQCTDQEKVLFAARQLFGTTAEWWEMYRNSHRDVGAITRNEFKARFRTHYVPRGMLKLKKKEFSELQQDGMTVNEYLNKFTKMSRYAPDEVSTDEKKLVAFLNGLNDQIQFQLLNTDYEDFQKMVDKAIIIESKIKEMEKNGQMKTSISGQSSGSNTRPRLPQLGPFFRDPSMVHPSMHGLCPPFHMQ
jgi:predicted transcriptional regulator